MKKRLPLGIIMLLACVSHAKTITGTVTDSKGDPILGATVFIKGSSNVTSTDFDGNYSINAVDEDVIVFSFTGYTTVSTKVKKRTVVNITLQESLDAVTIMGYRNTTQKTTNVASSTITSLTTQNRPNGNIVQTLTGQVAGLNINSNSGQPEGNSTIPLRGVASINKNSEPLFIIDGIFVNQDNLRSLSPQNVENVTVLKDAVHLPFMAVEDQMVS